MTGLFFCTFCTCANTHHGRRTPINDPPKTHLPAHTAFAAACVAPLAAKHTATPPATAAAAVATAAAAIHVPHAKVVRLPRVVVVVEPSHLISCKSKAGEVVLVSFIEMVWTSSSFLNPRVSIPVSMFDGNPTVSYSSTRYRRFLLFTFYYVHRLMDVMQLPRCACLLCTYLVCTCTPAHTAPHVLVYSFISFPPPCLPAVP